jgi:uncharacterized protein (TIGR02001 family)
VGRTASRARLHLRKRTSPGLLPIAAALAFHSSPAAAQTSAAISLSSDDRFRGYSLSDGRPVGILDVSYDASNGLYGAVSGSLVASRGDGLQPLELLVNAGYARRLQSGLTIDAGITHSAFARYSDRAAGQSYTEVYAGFSRKFFTARVYASPDYLRHGSLYGELNASVPAGKLRFTGHIGLLVPLGGTETDESYRSDLDWKLGISRQFGPVSVQAAWTAVRPGHDLYRYRYHSRNALILGLTYAL